MAASSCRFGVTGSGVSRGQYFRGEVRGNEFRLHRLPAMARDIDSPADDLRDYAARAKREAEATADPKKKQRLKKIAEDDQAQAIDIENDVA
jgi:hypothetical protein